MDATATTPSGGPPRPDAAVGVPRRERRWLPTVVVFAVIVATVAGGFVVAAVLSEPAGPPVAVGGVVQVQPLTGWEAGNASSMLGHPFARLTRGGANLDVTVAPSTGADPRAVADTYVSDVLERQLTGVSVSNDLHPVLLDHGETGLRFDYVAVGTSGAPVAGEITVAVTPSGDGVVFDGWAPDGLLTFATGDLHTMEARAVFT